MSHCFLSQAASVEGRLPSGVFTVGMPALQPGAHLAAQPRTVSAQGEEGKGREQPPAYLNQTVAQQSQVPVPHGSRAHQYVGVLAVMPFVIDRQHHPAEDRAGGGGQRYPTPQTL